MANENEGHSTEELLLSFIDNTEDQQLTRFALRLALSGHVAIPAENAFDFLTEADAVFPPPQPKQKKKSKPAKVPTPIKPVMAAAKKTERTATQNAVAA